VPQAFDDGAFEIEFDSLPEICGFDATGFDVGAFDACGDTGAGPDLGGLPRPPMLVNVGSMMGF
jgi:hypothetical protein